MIRTGTVVSFLTLSLALTLGAPGSASPRPGGGSGSQGDGTTPVGLAPTVDLDTSRAPQDPAPAPSRPDAAGQEGSDDAVSKGDGKKSDAELAQWIVSTYETYPQDVRRIGRDRLFEIHALTDRIIEACRQHYESYPDSPHRAEVLSILGYLLFLNLDRVIQGDLKTLREGGIRVTPEELMDMRRDYLSHVHAYLEEGLTLEPSPKIRQRLLIVAGDAYSVVGEADKAAPCFEAVIRDYPDEAEDALMKLCSTLLGGERYAQAETRSREFLARYPRSSYYPHVFFFLHKSLRYQGKPEEGLNLWNRFAPILEAGAEGKPRPGASEEDTWVVPEERRNDYRMYLERLNFYRGFYRYALGQKDRALALFEKFFEETESSTNDATKVYRMNMALPLMQTIRSFGDTPVPSIDLGDGWVVAPQKDEPPAKATLILFAGQNRADSLTRPVFKGLARLYEKNFSRGLRMRWISYGTRRERLPEEQQRMETFAHQEGIAWPYGLDLGPDYAAHTTFHFNRGPTTILVLDASRRVVWQLLDPRGWDEAMIERAVENVLSR